MDKKTKKLKAQFPFGTRIIVDYIKDTNSIKEGTTGIVKVVDDIGTIHCVLDDGSIIGLIPELDKFHIIEK